ncbi:MAG: alpha/beta hydrolase [Patescibacteria group bacterium]|nr:alpha/beta hydrolase [Patescibacteria group bacterium]
MSKKELYSQGIYYEINKKKDMVIYLHGSTSNLTCFKRYREYFLKKDYGYISIDMRGHGKSKVKLNKEKCKLKFFVEDVKKIINHEKIEKVIIVSHSIGTLIAQSFAANYPNKIKGMVIISATYNPTKSFATNFFKKILLPFTNLMRWVVYYSRIIISKPSKYRDFSIIDWTKLSPLKFYWEYSRGNVPRNPKESFMMENEMMKWDTEQILKKIRCPVLLIHGKKDNLINYRFAYKLKKKIRSSKSLTILNGGHGIIFTNYYEVRDLIEKFIKEKKENINP